MASEVIINDSGFFDSVNGDRVYSADKFARYFRKVLTDGVLYENGTEFQVVAPETGMVVNVNPGYALVQGYYGLSESTVSLDIAPADATYGRIDRIVLRLDLNSDARVVKLAVLTGTPASTPTPSALTRDGTVFELSLAQILVRAGTGVIYNTDITDERQNTDVCGFVKSRINMIDFETWFQQSQNDFNTWFETVQNDVIDRETAILTSIIFGGR
jgi:hypothetical protein